MKLKFEPTELTPLFKEVVDAFEPLASGRSVKLRTEVEREATATVDRSAVRQILLNLLDNAVKYGPAGQTVTLGLEVQNGTVQLRVGCGSTTRVPEFRPRAAKVSGRRFSASIASAKTRPLVPALGSPWSASW
jgi:signal transduction histidine kinase